MDLLDNEASDFHSFNSDREPGYVPEEANSNSISEEKETNTIKDQINITNNVTDNVSNSAEEDEEPSSIRDHNVDIMNCTHDKGKPPVNRRQKDGNSNKKVVRKRKLEAGEEYVSTAGKLIPPKVFVNTPCRCSRKCNDSVPPEKREKIFKEFYSLSWELKSAFIMTHVEVVEKKRKYAKSSVSRRAYTRIYKFPSFDDAEGSVVCKTFFKQTLQVSDGKIDLTLKKKQNSGGPVSDKRGRHEPHNKAHPNDIKFICDFISEFPVYNSHYSRKDNSSKQYLPPGLSVSELYRLYKERCSTDQKVACLSTFRDVFKSNFNLSFYAPKSDTCQRCDALNAKIKSTTESDEKRKLLTEQELHHRKATAAKVKKDEDTAEAKGDETKKVLIFDLQKTLPIPSLSTSVAYYKRQMWTFNLGVHDAVTSTGYMYVWSENIASRGPQEIGSCLVKHIHNFLPPQVNHLILYSDSCGGQNRNIKMSLFLSHLLQTSPTLQIIDQKFFVPGHSFNSCDQDFAVIEKAKRFHPEIYIPDHWAKMITNAKKKEPKFKVTKMTTDDFFSTTPLEKDVVNRKTLTDGKKVEWLKTCWIRLEKENPRVLKMKQTHNDCYPFSTLDLNRRVKGRRQVFVKIELPLLYPSGREITKEKIKDLLDLCQYIPLVHHYFYKQLKGGDDVEDIDPLVESEPDDGQESVV